MIERPQEISVSGSERGDAAARSGKEVSPVSRIVDYRVGSMQAFLAVFRPRAGAGRSATPTATGREVFGSRNAVSQSIGKLVSAVSVIVAAAGKLFVFRGKYQAVLIS